MNLCPLCAELGQLCCDHHSGRQRPPMVVSNCHDADRSKALADELAPDWPLVQDEPRFLVSGIERMLSTREYREMFPDVEITS